MFSSLVPVRLIAVVAALAVCLAAAQSLPAESKAQHDARMKWWREARFGMFIHFGVFSVAAGEWNGKPIGGMGEWIMHDARIRLADYGKLQQQFNPVKFDAKTWA